MARPRSVADIESFITLVRVADEDAGVRAALTRLLARTDPARRAFVHAWVSELLVAGAPADFIDAIACLADDAIAARLRGLIAPDTGDPG